MSHRDDSGLSTAAPIAEGGLQPARGLVFISHEKSDDGLAHEIRDHLASRGFPCWMAPDDIRGPRPWPEQIAAAIDSCDVMLVVVSAHANGSPHVSREVDLAVEKGKPLLPVRVEDIVPTGSLDYLLRLAQWVDLFPGSISDHAASLQSMVGAMMADSGIMPPEPQPATSTAPSPTRRLPHRTRRAAVIVLGVVALLAISGIAITAIVSALQPGDEGDNGQASVSGSVQTDDAVSGEQASDDADLISRVSVSSTGIEADDHSSNPSISADGRYIAFDSLASNLVENDTNGHRDVFVHDRHTGETTRISWTRQDNGVWEESNGASHDPQISADGRFVAFVSDATNLNANFPVPEGVSDVFLHDRMQPGAFSLVSIDTSSLQQQELNSIDPAMSDDATMIAYATYAGQQRPANAPGTGSYTVWVHDVATGTTARFGEFDTAAHLNVSPPSIAPDGSVALVSGNDGGTFRYDRATGVVTRLPEIPDVGAVLAVSSTIGVFHTTSPLVAEDVGPIDVEDIYNYDWTTDEFTLLFEGGQPRSLSTDGQFVAVITSPNLGHEPLILNTNDGTTFRVPGGPIGLEVVDLSGDGRWAAYSTSEQVVAGDTNRKQDIFVVELPVDDLAIDDQADSRVATPRAELTRVDGTDFGGWLPVGVAIDATGRVLVTDEAGNAVRVFDAEGTYLTSFEAEAPYGIAVGPDGDIYTTSHEIGTVQKFDSEGNVQPTWGEPGQLDTPVHIAVDDRGFVYVAENRRVQKFDGDGFSRGGWDMPEEGEHLGPVFGITIGEFDTAPCSLCATGTVIFYGQIDSGEVRRQQTDGSPAGSQWSAGRPNGLDIDAAGNVYVAGGGSISRYDANGVLLETWGSGSFYGDGPFDVAVTSTGEVWATDKAGFLIRYGR